MREEGKGWRDDGLAKASEAHRLNTPSHVPSATKAKLIIYPAVARVTHRCVECAMLSIKTVGPDGLLILLTCWR